MLDMGLPASAGGWVPLSDPLGRVGPVPSPAPPASEVAAARDHAGRDGAGAPACEPAFLDIPCSMLVRDLAAVCGDGWVPLPPGGDDSAGEGGRGGHVLIAPKGSRIVVPGPDSAEVVAALRSAGPKVLQVFALALDLWVQGAGGRDPAVASVRRVTEFSRALTAGPHGGRDHESIRGLLDALGRIRFETGPGAGGLRSGDSASGAPGPPLRLHTAPPEGGSGLVAFSPGPAWVKGLVGSGYRVARLPRSFLGLHARNDRYVILLSWYLAIMLRVNRKHGFRYRVGLRTLLEGAGIEVPGRNVSRFLAAIYRALEDLPAIRVRAPALTMYDPPGMLASMIDVSIDPVLLVDYTV